MRKLLFAAMVSTAVAGAWDVGFNFRSSASFVTDPTSTTFVSMEQTRYPTTRTIGGQTVTFGWESVASSYAVRDRVTSYDPRVAGINCQSDAELSVFRVDLPAAGSYVLGLGIGDPSYGGTSHVVVLSGASTSLLAVNVVNPANYVGDATGTLRVGTTWASTNATVQRTFASTILRLQIGGQNDGAYSCISHLRVTTAPAPAAVVSGQFFLQ